MKKNVLFFMFLLMGTMCASAQSNKYDLNDDGVVNVTDVIQLVNYILGKDNGGQDAHEAVDLGLPSGTKWASCNIGATKPEEYGSYFAWGETEEKEIYNWETYIHCDGTSSTCHNLGSDISGTEYDVAHVKWGGKWVMPNLSDYKELLNNCTTQEMYHNGIYCMKFTSKINGNSIFMPAGGACSDKQRFYNVGSIGYLWLSTEWFNSDKHAYSILLFDADGAGWMVGSYRSSGLNVRPVLKN